VNQKDYEIEKYEERLKKIKELQEKIDNPEDSRLLLEHKQFEKECKTLLDKKTTLYKELKAIIKKGHQLILKEDTGEVCFYKGVDSMAGHPELHYFFEGSCWATGGIATFRGAPFKNLKPKEFMDMLMSGKGFMKKSSR
jgi:hypothetical protein